MFCLPFYSLFPDQTKTRKKCKKCEKRKGCRCDILLDKPKEGHGRRNLSKTHFDNINKTTEDKTFSNDCFNAHKENISNMFRSIEVWIADQKKGQHYKQIKEGLNTLEDSEQKGFNELSWEVTLRPKNNIRIRDSLWV